jgi:uncharacterized protein (TIGR01777 family)
MKKIAITGASGFVGQHLTKMFESDGYEVIAIRISDLDSIDKLISLVDGCDIVINLAGANIISRWSQEYKKVLYSSRIDTTKAVVKSIQKCENKPKLFISTSAIGIYSNKKVYDEENIEYADDFLGNLCKDWESEALKAKNSDIRTVVFRFGIVMGKDGGALSKMLLPFKLGLGGTVGSGSQAFSFVHIDDLTNAYKYAVENTTLSGVYNITAPVPTTNYGLTKALGKSLHRPTILPVPQFVLNLIFSEGAKVLTHGQSVVPKRLQDDGFIFKYKTIEETIENLVGEN